MKRQAWMLAALLAPGFAFAQGSAQQGQQSQQGQQPQQAQQGQQGQQAQQGQGQEAAISGSFRGIVENVDYDKGQLQLRPAEGQGEAGESQGAQFTVHGTPGQLQNYKQGEVANVNYVQYGQNRWLSQQQGQTGSQMQMARQATIQGRVEQVNKADGTLQIATAQGGAEKLKAHPQAIEKLVPGQFVSVTYQKVQNSNWVNQIQQQGAQQGQQQGSQPGQQQGQQQGAQPGQQQGMQAPQQPAQPGAQQGQQGQQPSEEDYGATEEEDEGLFE